MADGTTTDADHLASIQRDRLMHTIEKCALVLALALIAIFRPEKLVTVEQTAAALGAPVAQVAPIVSAVTK